MVGIMADGIAREGFDIDLRFGQERETTFAEILMIRGGNHVELKSDQKAHVTGNVFVEYRQHGRESGIATTKAHWWTVEVLPDVFVTLPTSRMKALMKAVGKRTSGGDYNAYRGCLVPVKYLVQPWTDTDQIEGNP